VRAANVLKRGKYSVLLGLTLLAEVLQPMAKTEIRGMLFDFLILTVVVIVFWVVFDSRRQHIIALALSVPALVTNWLHYIRPSEAFAEEILYHLLMFGFFAFAGYGILKSIFERRETHTDAVVGALCGYLFASAAFANLYTLVEEFQPGSFAINTAIASQLTNWHTRRFLFGYFSLVTLTSMGYGDITPVTPATATLTWMEAVFGQFYLAVVVATLVGMRIGRPASEAAPPIETRK
jgi:hypothetical protein